MKSLRKTKGEWQIDLDDETPSDPAVTGWIEHKPSGFTASIGAMEMTGVVTNQHGEEERPVPENIQEWVIEEEEKYHQLVTGN